MAAYFLDTSTVVKRYVREIGTSWVQALAAPAAGHSLIVVRITLAETVAAVTRRERTGHTSPQEAARALGDFQPRANGRPPDVARIMALRDDTDALSTTQRWKCPRFGYRAPAPATRAEAVGHHALYQQT